MYRGSPLATNLKKGNRSLQNPPNARACWRRNFQPPFVDSTYVLVELVSTRPCRNHRMRRLIQRNVEPSSGNFS